MHLKVFWAEFDRPGAHEFNPIFTDLQPGRCSPRGVGNGQVSAPGGVTDSNHLGEGTVLSHATGWSASFVSALRRMLVNCAPRT